MMNEQDRQEIRREFEQRLGSMAGFKRTTQQQYDAASTLMRGIESGAISSWERREPISRQRSIATDFTLPALKSAMTGLLPSLGLLFAGADLQQSGLAFLAGTTLAWLLQMVNDSRLNWRIERIVGRDLDGDGWVGEPDVQPESLSETPPAPRTVRWEAYERTSSNHWRVRFGELPQSITDDKLICVARAVLHDGVPLSRRELSNVLTRWEYDQLYESMKAQRLLFTVGKRNELTGSGRRLFEQILA